MRLPFSSSFPLKISDAAPFLPRHHLLIDGAILELSLFFTCDPGHDIARNFNPCFFLILGLRSRSSSLVFIPALGSPFGALTTSLSWLAVIMIAPCGSGCLMARCADFQISGGISGPYIRAFLAGYIRPPAGADFPLSSRLSSFPPLILSLLSSLPPSLSTSVSPTMDLGEFVFALHRSTLHRSLMPCLFSSA